MSGRATEPPPTGEPAGMPKNSGRGAVPRIDRPFVSILPWVVGLVVAGLTVSAATSLALDPAANDGAAMIIACFGVPMVVIAVVIQLVAHNSLASRRTRFNFLWWLFAVLPAGILLLSIPTILSDPVYFRSSTPAGFWGTLAMHGALVVIGVLFAPLLWFFVVMPVPQLASAVVGLVRREKGAHVRLIMPVFLLMLTAFILFGAGALDLSNALPGRFAWPQIVLAMLGLPGNYRVESTLFLWICRGILVVVAISFFAPWWRRQRRAAPASPATPTDEEK